jgi:hypothetical protein
MQVTAHPLEQVLDGNSEHHNAGRSSSDATATVAGLHCATVEHDFDLEN